MKTITQALAAAEAALAPIGAASAIVHGDYLSVFAEFMAALQAGGGLELPSQGASPVLDSVTGTSWQALDLFSAEGESMPDGAPYRGLVPSPAGNSLTVETGGNGIYLVLYHLSCDATEAFETAIQRQRDAATFERIASRLPGISGAYVLGLQEDDLVRVVGRTRNGLTCNLSYWSAQLFALRVLPT